MENLQGSSKFVAEKDMIFGISLIKEGKSLKVIATCYKNRNGKLNILQL